MSLEKRIDERTAKVAVIGLGYVGMPLLALANQRGFSAVGLDIDAGKVAEAKAQGLDATMDAKDALATADVVAICVPTPIDEDQRPDLRAVKAAASAVAQNLSREALVILESTVAPGTVEEVLVPILERSSIRVGSGLYAAHCPERIDPGNPKWDVHNLPRVVGGVDDKSLAFARAFYTRLLDAPVMALSSVKAAEAVKIVENTFRDVNIAFVNELARSFDKIGIDLTEVIRGAATKPFGFLPHYPGAGVGGHCIAVDPYYLIDKAGKHGFDHRFLKLARDINSGMPGYTVERTLLALNEVQLPIKGTRIALLGLAYKGGVSDLRESPALRIRDELNRLGADLVVYDPYIPDGSTARDLEAALRGSACVVIATDHKEFKGLTGARLKQAGVRVVMDGRNILDQADVMKAGIVYRGIGRT